MSLIPWRNKREEQLSRPTAPLADFRRDLDQWMESVFRRPWSWPFEGGAEGWVPPLDISETDQEITVRAELPGVDPKDLDISVLGDRLTLSGEKKESTERRDGDWFHRETHDGSFRRSVPLPSTVDPNQVTADYAQGVLTVKLHKSAQVQPKRIAIKAG